MRRSLDLLSGKVSNRAQNFSAGHELDRFNVKTGRYDQPYVD